MTEETGKTLRPNTQVDKTLRPNTQVDKTLRPNNAPIDKTMRPKKQQDETDRIIHQDVTEFILEKRIKYNVIKIISQNTGEADIYLVENNGKQFVLKLYFWGYKQNHGITDIIVKNAGSGFLVDILEHGMWINPQSQQERDYELMVYYEGGSLDQLSIEHNANGEKLLGEIALKCACSLDFLHKNQIIHGDVKPANFFFRHQSKHVADMALADFGIAKLCNKDGVVNIPFQERTKIYAAPEYYDIIQGEIQISTKTDFFALGMTLLTLWNGEETYNKMNEFQLKDHKKHGTLEYPKDMSDKTLQLIMALTLPNPNVRAGLKEVIRWANNEDIYDLKSKKENIHRFNILFNAAKNQVADSPEKLAEFMLHDRELSVKYLYSGKIVKWLSDNLRPELAQEIEDIIENQYPKDKYAGLYASRYVLDRAMPYYDVKNKIAASSEEIAQSLLNNFEYYQEALKNQNDSLFLFFNAHGAANITQEFAPLFKKNDENRDALLQLIHTLDPTLPWVITTDENKIVECYTPEDVLNARYEYIFSDESWEDLISEAFLVWLRHVAPAIEGKVRMQKDHNERQTVVLYNLSPKVAYNFQLDENADDYFFTAEEIGNFMNIQMEDYIEDENDSYADYHLTVMCSIDDTPLYDYFKSKGVYDDKIEWIKYCSDVKSTDNANKAGPYDWAIGIYKAIKGLGFDPYYFFPKSKKQVFTLDELNLIPSKEIKEELEKGYLQCWLTIFFQEDPWLDLSQKYAYEREVVDYLEYLKKIEPKNNSVVNYNIAKDSVTKTLNFLKRHRNRHVRSKILFGSLTLIAAVAVIFGLLTLKISINVQDHLNWINTAAIIAAVLGFGSMYLFSDKGCLVNLIAGVMAGAIFYAILYFCIPYVGYIALGLLVTFLAIWFIKSYLKYPVIDKAAETNGVDHAQLLNPTFEEYYLEPLHFAYSDDQSFKSSIADQSFDYAEYLHRGTKRFYKQLILPWLLILALGFAVVFFSPMRNKIFNFTKEEISVESTETPSN